MKALIIDDEEKARILLKILLQENCPQILEIKTAKDLPEGVRAIQAFRPDIVFLDIEMPEYSGLQITEFLRPEQIDFEIVFTTAYSEFAIKAFELNAIDYLLKPLRDEQLIRAVNKAEGQIGKSQLNQRLEELKSVLQANKIQKIGLPVSNGVLFVKFEDIIFLEAERMYTKFYTRDNGTILVSKPIKFFMANLTETYGFYRPHRSFVINLRYIKQYVNQDGGYILMENDKTVNLSKNNKEEFLRLIQVN
ncbi:LytR/AlgR family response regulator transcription factor [Sediminicola luteus]|uniref:DNA-binding response regulator n=1 Tax=Sediminicola luteus TaxID=319238 RepID=A0A2A4G8Z7_9FLAO|nr:LytTR family DNA-binding domain-containing protein [Sediminicola luteus]PCE64913.1 DNA-binding response regulator [Sediminicola luteus]